MEEHFPCLDVNKRTFLSENRERIKSCMYSAANTVLQNKHNFLSHRSLSSKRAKKENSLPKNVSQK
uniref:Uncharacterized protein n=1 Tax=Human betaherpesvirus 6 TaxID=10368 RepID=A0A1W6JB24_9BETA|nr:hypothetical protein [Human betaherpesvirus 6]